MSVYLCIKCGAWFDTREEMKTHICGKVSKVSKKTPSIIENPVTEQEKITIDVAPSVIPIPENIEVVTEIKQEEVPEFLNEISLQKPKTREELMIEAKSLGYDMRIFKNKADDFIQQKIEEKLKRGK